MLEQIASPTRVIAVETMDATLLDRLARAAAGAAARVCCIVDPRMMPARDRALTGLAARRAVQVLDRVRPNPSVEDIAAMVDAARPGSPDVIIGIGGGSTLDSARAVAMVLANGGDLEDYLGPQARRTVEKRGPKLILVPTTTGTGAEVTRFGVYTARSGRKYSLASPLITADCALLVTELVLDIPAPLLAATGFDALSHALETLWNRNATPVSDGIATDAAVDILQCIEIAYHAACLGETAGKKELYHAACRAGIAFNLTGTAAVHALSFILSEEWHVPHGVACAFFTEDVMRLNETHEGTRAKLCAVARRLVPHAEKRSEAELVQALHDRVTSLKQRMGLPSTFEALGVSFPEDRIPALFDKCLEDFKMKNNVVEVTPGVLHDIVRGKLGGALASREVTPCQP